MDQQAIIVHAYQGIIDSATIHPTQEGAEAVLDGVRAGAETEGRMIFDTNIAPEGAVFDFQEREEWRLFTCEAGGSVICRSLFTS
jgi:hypothetical protein